MWIWTLETGLVRNRSCLTLSYLFCPSDQGLPGADWLLQGVSVQTGRRLHQRCLRHSSQSPQVSSWSGYGGDVCDDMIICWQKSEISVEFSFILSASPDVPPSPPLYSFSSSSSSSLQLHGGSESASEGGWFPDEEGAWLLCHGSGEASEALPGHPRRVRTVQLRSDCKQTCVKTIN